MQSIRHHCAWTLRSALMLDILVNLLRRWPSITIRRVWCFQFSKCGDQQEGFGTAVTPSVTRGSEFVLMVCQSVTGIAWRNNNPYFELCRTYYYLMTQPWTSGHSLHLWRGFHLFPIIYLLSQPGWPFQMPILLFSLQQAHHNEVLCLHHLWLSTNLLLLCSKPSEAVSCCMTKAWLEPL